MIDRLLEIANPASKEEKILSERADKDVKDLQKKLRKVGDEGWPYRFNAVDSIEIAGNEVHSLDEKGNHFAGSYVRSMIEDREYRPEDYTWLGYTQHPVRGVEPVGIPHKSLFRHSAIFGVTGFGKSTVLKNNMLQWIHADYGLCFIDPKGDDGKKLLSQIPKHREEDILWLELGNSESEEVIGFNFFDTYTEPGDPGHENEVDEIVADFVGILQHTTNGWGATMENVATAVTRQLVKSEESYNVVDMYKILNDEEEREAFQEFGTDIEQIYLKRLAKKETDEIDPLIRRVREWVENPITREIIAHEGSEVNITEAVESGKIILIDTSSIPDDDVKRLVSTAIIRRIWSTIQTRSNIDEEDREPYFLCIDEFDKVAGEGSNINDMLSKGRSFKLSILLANQQPNQLPESIQDSLYSNCDNLFTFNPGPANAKDASILSKPLGNIEPHLLMSLSRFQLLGRVTINDRKTDPLLIHTFPEYPPIRSKRETRKLKRSIVKRYGSERKIDIDDTSGYGILGRQKSRSNADAIEINDDGTTIEPKQILECVYAAQIKYETKTLVGRSKWVEASQLKDEIKKYVGDEIGYASVLDNVIEGIPEAWLEREVDGKVYFRLTGEGEQKVFQQDTGSSASGGKTPHRILLRDGHEAFTKLGYNVRLPTQDGESLPDGIAEPPINPFKDGTSLDEAEELKRKLETEYPRLYELFGDSTISLEAESTTITKPKQTIFNLAKAVEKGQKCVFLVKDSSREHDRMDHWARAGTEILTNPPLAADSDKHGNRTFYNTSQFLQLKDGSYALQKIPEEETRGYCTWREQYVQNPHGRKPHISLTRKGEKISQFESLDELKNPSRSKFPYHYYYDSVDKITVVQNSKGDLVDEFNTTKEMKEAGYRPIYQPLIPEHVFADGEYPSEDDWDFVILPGGENKSKGPQLYRDGTLTPLIPDDHPTTQHTEQTSSSTQPPVESSKTTSTTSVDQTDASPTQTQPSTNEVVKNSPDVWTPPEEGDDDYDPSKDNKNFRTGYKESGVGENWDGGVQRQEDDGKMKDYEIPDFAKPKSSTESNSESEPDEITQAVITGISENEGMPPKFKDARRKNTPQEAEEETTKSPVQSEEKSSTSLLVGDSDEGTIISDLSDLKKC